MKYQGREQSRNVEDRRGMSSGKMAAGGIGIGGLIVVLLVMLLGGDPQQALQEMSATQQQSSAPTGQASDHNDELAILVRVVLKETEDVFHRVFREQLNANYSEPVLVLFSGKVQSACGYASAVTGPFYCPGDQKLYIDLDFYQELQNRFGAPGDFAMAYVVAHEVGHHVQNLLGITDQLHQMRGRVSKAQYNEQSVRLELQADFLAGVWARETQRKGLLDEGDIEEALRAANAIGDDRLQKQAQGYVVPESFTHGTSEQRMRWFSRGFKSGDLRDGDTFNARTL